MILYIVMIYDMFPSSSFAPGLFDTQYYVFMILCICYLIFIVEACLRRAAWPKRRKGPLYNADGEEVEEYCAFRLLILYGKSKFSVFGPCKFVFFFKYCYTYIYIYIIYIYIIYILYYNILIYYIYILYI